MTDTLYFKNYLIVVLFKGLSITISIIKLSSNVQLQELFCYFINSNDE